MGCLKTFVRYKSANPYQISPCVFRSTMLSLEHKNAFCQVDTKYSQTGTSPQWHYMLAPLVWTRTYVRPILAPGLVSVSLWTVHSTAARDPSLLLTRCLKFQALGPSHSPPYTSSTAYDGFTLYDLEVVDPEPRIEILARSLNKQPRGNGYSTIANPLLRRFLH